ncbi:TonB-dependent receptor [Pararhodonellum marinum]|uniref:TonB-dependent receptor n=1 Tax=Pararhodonellum marinum TaxID=2755358 RepID=UPI00188E34AF|nr:TonB-dependent receptor [Pararhodonellum marinum]
MNNRLIIIGLFIALISSHAWGQDRRVDERGEIKDTEFIIRKDRVLTLPKQPRSFESAPALPKSDGLRNFAYDVKRFELDLPPLEIKAEPFQKNFAQKKDELYPIFAKLGLGNYAASLAELRFNSLQDDYMSYGAFFQHQGFYDGPVDGRNSSEDHTRIRLDGSLFIDYGELYGHVGYNRDMVHFYGYQPVESQLILADDIRQIFNTPYAQFGLRSFEPQSDFRYDVSINLRHFSDRLLAREGELGLRSLIAYKANEDFTIQMNADLFTTSPEDLTYMDINRNYFGLKPVVKYRNGNLNVEAGAKMVVENDQTDNKKSDFHLFPHVMANYQLVEEFGIYAGIDGDVVRMTYYDFVQENPFLGPSQSLLNNIQKYRFQAGIKGSFNEDLTYQVGFRFSQNANMHYFANSQADSTKFEMLYEENTELTELHGELTWNVSNLYRLNASASAFNYGLSSLEGAWHRPDWQIMINNIFQPTKEWLVQANVMAMGGIEVLNLQSGNTGTLNPIIDVSLKADYKITERFSVFAMGNNLLNQNNQRFWNYPVRGIQGMLGGTVKF